MNIRILAALGLLLALLACAQSPDVQKDQLVSEIRQLECAIGFAAIEQMHASQRLPDPDMVKGCPHEFDATKADIQAVRDAPTPLTDAGMLVQQRLMKRRFPAPLVTQISKSMPFSKLEGMITNLNRL
ncbi:MAG: hypothetical protein ACPGRD_01005 [Planktomarina sp.]